MTDELEVTATDETAEAPAAETADASETATEGDQDAPETGNKEAAKYRRRLRDAEAEIEKAREQVAALEARELEGLARDLHDAADFTRYIALEDLRDEAGSLDHAKAGKALDELKAARPYLFTETTLDIGQGATGEVPGTVTWQGAIRGGS